MNEVNNENIGNQMNYQNNNQPSNNNKSSNGLMVVIIILLLALIGVVAYAFILKPTDNKKGGSIPNNGTTNNEVQQPQNNETVEKEVEVSKDDYKYLIERLEKFGICPSCDDNISPLLNLDKISTEDKMLIAINNIKPEENAKINITDEIDYYNGETKKHTSYKLTKDDIANAYDDGYIYSAEKVESKVKEIFGKDTNVNHQAVGAYVYDKTAKLYFVIRGGSCGCGAGSFQEIDKVTTSENKLYIYTHAGYTSVDGYVCYENDIDEKDLNSSKCVNVVKKYSLNENANSYYDELDEKMNLIKQDKDKFTKYKYTFEKEDNNYIIKKLEKIS